MFKNFWPNLLKRLNPAATLRKIHALTSAADTQRLAASVGKAAIGGVIAAAMTGHVDPKALAAGAATGAGAAFLNFIKPPSTDSAQ